MKKTLLLSLAFLSLFFVEVFAQDASFPVDSARWCFESRGDQGQDLGTYCFSPLGFDTVNNLRYTIIEYLSGRSNPDEIRYRVDGQKVYVLPQDSLQEILLYDFGLSIGDTFEVKWGINFQGLTPFKVVVVDTHHIVTPDGVRRTDLRLGEQPGNEFSRWIEGIGDDWSHMFPAYGGSVSGWNSLKCFSIKGEDIYPSSNENCSTVSIDDPLSKVSMYPNPCDGVFFIDNTANAFHRIAITDVFGRLIARQRLSAGKNRFVLPDDVIEGLYLIKLSSRDGSVSSKKLHKR